jgi:hypothetical protein
LNDFIKAEVTRWSPVIKELKIKMN